MQKNEYLHLHALFAELRLHLQETGDVPPEAFTAYDAYNVAPTGLHRRKDQHHEALDRLRAGVLITLDARQQPVTESTTSMQTMKADSLTH